MWQLQLYCHVRHCAALELAHPHLPARCLHYLALDKTCSHSLALARDRQNSFALTHPPVGSHSLNSLLKMPFLIFEVTHWVSTVLYSVGSGAATHRS